MKASDLLVKCLETEEVKYVFGVPGEENEDLLFSLQDSSIKFIPTRHEQGAAFMADVYGRLTGKAGVCLATLGPGATNLITGVADAHLDKSPVVAITGQGNSDRLHKESHQYIDVVNLFKPIVKWNTTINRPGIIPEVTRKAFKLSEMEKPGATHLELPEDIAKLQTDAKPIEPVRVRRPGSDHKAILQLAALLKESKKPLIIAGNGAIRKLASKHLREFVAKTKIPVVGTFMGKGAISDRSEQSLMSTGLRGNDYVQCALKQSDLIITVGYDIAEVDPKSWNTGIKKKIAHIDFVHAEVYDMYQPAVEVVGDISAALWELNNIAAKENLVFDDSWYKQTREKMIEDTAMYDNKPAITIPAALRTMRKVMKDDDILISDVGSHKMWIARNFETYEPNTCIISNGFASMGIALPGGIASKLALPERNVVAVMGDGGFLMNSQEIETAKRLGVGYVIVVFNDNNYGLITWKQESHTGTSFGTALTNPDFELYAKSFGINGASPKNLIEFKDTLAKALASKEMWLIELKIDVTPNKELMQKLASKECNTCGETHEQEFDL